MPAQPSSAKTALLTVGSTQFDDLVKAALEPASLQALRNHGITRFIVQYGEGNIRQILRYVALDPEGGFPTVSGGVSCTINTGEDVHVEMYPFLDDIDQRMSSADIVISHAGRSPCIRIPIQKEPVLTASGCIRRRIRPRSTSRSSTVASEEALYTTCDSTQRQLDGLASVRACRRDGKAWVGSRSFSEVCHQPLCRVYWSITRTRAEAFALNCLQDASRDYTRAIKYN